MPTDHKKPRGQTKRSSPTSGGANPKLTPAIGTVKYNADSTRSGRIWVYIAGNSGPDPDNIDNWKPVNFLSPYYGKTPSNAPTTGEGNYKDNTHSYGMWFSPPDIGTEVLCLFTDGDMNFGFYIGCIPDPEALHMVPAIGAVPGVKPNESESKKYGSSVRLPVTNVNNNNKDITNTGKYLTEKKPVHGYVAASMFQQGILRDPIRGPISTSAQRENISRVGFGISTPGRPIYQGGFDDSNIADNLTEDKADQLKIIGRRGGHSIVMDDGDVVGRDQLVRIRTADGHQITMSDDGQTIFIIHKNGQSYVELGKEGTVDIYSTNSINLRTEGDLNLHADNNVNIHAKNKLQMYGKNVKIQAESDIKQRAGQNFVASAEQKFQVKAENDMSFDCSGTFSASASSQMLLKGSKIKLNCGGGASVEAVAPIERNQHTDTIFDEEKGFLASPGTLESITSRAPAHAPWVNANQGVTIEADLNAKSKLPSAPSASVLATNLKSATTGVKTPVIPSTIAKAPSVSNASSSLDNNVTKALTGQAATQALAQTADAVKKGVAVTKSSTDATQVNIGQFGMTPEQLEKAQVIKRGSAALVKSLIATGANVSTALPPSLFTGKPGAENYNAFIKNLPAQSDALVKNLQSAQTGLRNAGVLTGKESASQIGGMILSASKNSVPSVLGEINSATPHTDGGLAGIPTIKNLNQSTDAATSNKTLSDINEGNYASQLGENPGGVLDGIIGSTTAVVKSPNLKNVTQSTRGPKGNAFEAIKNAIPDLKADESVDLTQVAKQVADQVNDASMQAATNQASQQANGLINNAVTNKLIQSNNVVGSQVNNPTATSTNILPSSSSVASSLLNAVGKNNATNTMISGLEKTLPQSLDKMAIAAANPNSLLKNSTLGEQALTSAAKTVASGGVSSSASTIASGLSNLPGGQAAIGSVTNLSKGNTPILPNIENLKSKLTSLSTDALNNISNSVGNAATNLINKISNTSINKAELANGITSLVTKNLPAGTAALIQSTVASIASSGSGIKMPSVGINTSNRKSIESAVASALGDPSIPAPNYGGVSEASAGKIDALENSRADFIDKQTELLANFNKANSDYYVNYNAYLTAENNFPQGSPALQPLKTKYEQSFAQRNAYKDQLLALYNQYPELATSSTNTTGNA